MWRDWATFIHFIRTMCLLSPTVVYYLYCCDVTSTKSFLLLQMRRSLYISYMQKKYLVLVRNDNSHESTVRNIPCQWNWGRTDLTAVKPSLATDDTVINSSANQGSVQVRTLGTAGYWEISFMVHSHLECLLQLKRTLAWLPVGGHHASGARWQQRLVTVCFQTNSGTVRLNCEGRYLANTSMWTTNM